MVRMMYIISSKKVLSGYQYNSQASLYSESGDYSLLPQNRRVPLSISHLSRLSQGLENATYNPPTSIPRHPPLL